MNGEEEAKRLPAFAVVGRVNKGKSSVVSTLAEDETVRIGREARTTRKVTAYRWSVDGTAYYEVLDTPGFERAEAALSWMRARAGDATERFDAVSAFVGAHEGGDEFSMECRLLSPVLEGAAIVYVADATHPWRNHFMAELEILKWTGRPLIGLLNRTDGGKFEKAWRAHLRDCCHTVRVFDAHTAGFEERIGLMRVFRELAPEAAKRIDVAIDALNQDWLNREAEAVAEIARFAVSAVTYSRDEPLSDEEDLQRRRSEIEASFHDVLKKMETRTHHRLARLYRHERLRVVLDELKTPALEADLFTAKVWRNLGLTPRQLAAGGAAGGAAVGVVGDVAAGGLTFGVLTLGGALLGGAGGLAAALGRIQSPARIVEGTLQGGRRVRVGPHRNPLLGSVLVDRALLLLLGLQGRPHARRDPLRLEGAARVPEENSSLLRSLSPPARKELGHSLVVVHRAARRRRKVTAKEIAALEDAIAQALEAMRKTEQPENDDDS